MHEKTYWDLAADQKIFTTPFDIKAFHSSLDKGFDTAILDYGCGYGRILGTLIEGGFKNLAGCDISTKMIERAKASYPDIDFKTSIDNIMPYPDKSFDAITLLALITCIHKDTDLKVLINEVKRVLRTGGILYVNDFLLNTDERNVKRYKKFEDKLGIYGAFRLPEGVVVRHFAKAFLDKLFKDFECVQYKSMDYITMNGNQSNGFMYIGKIKKC